MFPQAIKTNHPVSVPWILSKAPLSLSLSGMASPHHHHHGSSHHSHFSTSSPGCCCCCCFPSNSQSTPLTPTDPLLQAIATQIFQSTYLKPQNPQQYPRSNYPLKQPQPSQSLLLLQSLLRRVSALESSLAHFSPPTSHPLSLRDIAARTIQTHFRAFLVRRSQTLRHLKRLASIKSSIASLKSSLSDKTFLHRPEALSQKAINLIHELESIQSSDSMIREGKRAVSRELFRLLEFLDAMVAKRQVNSSKSMRKVSSLEHRNQSRAFTDSQEAFPGVEAAGNGTCAADQRDYLEKLSRGVEGLGGFSTVLESDDRGIDFELEGFQQISDDDGRNPRSLQEEDSYGMSGIFQDKNGDFGFSADPLPKPAKVNYGAHQGQNRNLGLMAPLPVHMEEMRGSDLSKKKKFVRIVG